MGDTLRIALKGSGKVRVSIQQGNNKDFFLEAIEDWARLTKAGRAVIKAGELAAAEDPDGLIWETLKTLVQDCHINREVRERITALTAPQNDPLTLEELLDMVGKPVYVHLSNGRKKWAMVSSFGGAPTEKELMLIWGVGLYAPASTYISNGSRIYRREPEPET